ncbi:hypothetical protein BDV93DRAFT_523957 [Ceratobasidium sp. AG-I]|nr:hypothetical protein BDV93DRAFT_523957 [Ceratobasidium sp. AG-I]
MNALSSKKSPSSPGPRPSSSRHRLVSDFEGEIHRPLGLFHPTHLHQPGTETHWSSRASRKGRYGASGGRHQYPSVGIDGRDGRKGGWWARGRVRKSIQLEGDISFWVAVVFVLGSIAWVINGFLLLLPILSPEKYPEHETAAAAFAFIGGTVFELGGYLMFVESLNTGHDELFGEALRDELDELEGRGKGNKKVGFRWWGRQSWRDLGFLASSIQFAAATIFWVSTLTGLPGVIPNLYTSPSVAIADIFFWTPQVIGALGFVISSVLIMIETQRAWWKPNLTSLGWHVGLFNLIGAIGFLLCGAFGYAALSSTKAEYQSALSTFWGGWAFLIGSGAQLWESVWREDETDQDSLQK